ncbi:MAG: prenyltransferase/squalene oxidase repeat-containing protein [Rubripirellula sp.]
MSGAHRTRFCGGVFVSIAIFFVQNSVLAAGPSVTDPRRDCVAKAIPYLESEGQKWIDDRGCVSCHQIPSMLWSLSAAHENGYVVDPDKLQRWQSWAIQTPSFVKPEEKENVDTAKTLAANIDTMNALLLASDSAADWEDSGWRRKFTSALVENQADDGSWKACGQLPAQKRPAKETTQVTVLWSLLALASQRVEVDRQQDALDFCRNTDPKSTEWYVVRVLLAAQLGDDELQGFRKQLVAKQREDGGWGWLTGDPSDALATGMALYALRKTSSGDEQVSAIRSASSFLIGTQQKDGSWLVPGTKKSTRKKNTTTSNYWGTAWAVIGLLE